MGNLIHPGAGLQSAAASASYTVPEAQGSGNFIIDIIPTTLFSSLTAGSVLQALFVALLVGFAVQAMGSKGEPVLNFVTVLQRLVFKILGGIMWLAPVGAFGAIAGVVGNAGRRARRPRPAGEHHVGTRRRSSEPLVAVRGGRGGRARARSARPAAGRPPGR